MWNFDGKPIDRYFLEKLDASIIQYGPDQADEQGRGGPGEYVHENVAMIYRPFHTNKESRLERQPYVTYCKDTGAVRNVMTWDGRLDNRFDLMAMLGSDLAMNHPSERTDVAIVMAAWERWGTECFKKLIGDFSLAVWSAQYRTLTLAKDFIGVRYLYYELLPEGVRGGARSDPELGDAQPPSGPCVWWCSRLEPLILLSGRQYEINEEYIAGYFAFHPANHLTPYVGVDALRAGHYVQIHNGQKKLVQYWRFDPDKRITYKTDAEYEEHFRQVFFQSVKRRLRADAPVVAGLSGGRDSSAIVCVADELITRGETKCPRLDTYSRYAEDEPFQDDKLYLTIVEQKRGRPGYHICLNRDEATIPPQLRQLGSNCFSAHPGFDQDSAQAVQRHVEFMKANGYRIILSGIGGDEVTGGVPNCVAELADLLLGGKFIRLAGQLKAWALAQKRPWTGLAWTTLRSIIPEWLPSASRNGNDVWPWVDRAFAGRQFSAFAKQQLGFSLRHGSPSFQARVSGTAGISRQFANLAKLHRYAPQEKPYDRGFPFLDRDFLEFMFAVPRSQILRPGQYRSLMRRALAGVVPREILNRTRKAFTVRGSALRIQAMAQEIRGLFKAPLSETMGFINATRFLQSADDLAAGTNTLMIPIKKAILLELWLRTLAGRGILAGSAPWNIFDSGVVELTHA